MRRTLWRNKPYQLYSISMAQLRPGKMGLFDGTLDGALKEINGIEL